MTRSLVSAEQHSVTRPETITELFGEYDAYLFRVRNLAFDTVKIRRLYLNRAATLLSLGTAADHFFALPQHLQQVLDFLIFSLKFLPGFLKLGDDFGLRLADEGLIFEFLIGLC